MSARPTAERIAWIRKLTTLADHVGRQYAIELLAELDAVMGESQAFYEQRNAERRLVTDLRISLDAVTRERDELRKRMAEAAHFIAEARLATQAVGRDVVRLANNRAVNEVILAEEAAGRL